MYNSEQTPQKNELTIHLNTLGSVEQELKELASHCLSLEIHGLSDKEGYKVARAELTNLISKRTGIDKTAKPFFDLIKDWKLKGDEKVKTLKGLIIDAENHLSKIVKDWKTADDLRKAQEKAAREKLLRERTQALENAGAAQKSGFFILDELSVSLESVKKQSEERFEILVEQFQEKNLALIKLAESRKKEVREIDPKSKPNIETLKRYSDEEFQEYKELVQLRVEKRKNEAQKNNSTVTKEITGPVGETFATNNTSSEKPIETNLDDAIVIPDNLEDPKELLNQWFMGVSEVCNQNLETYKSPEREVLKSCKKDIIAVFSHAFAEMKKIEQLKAA